MFFSRHLLWRLSSLVWLAVLATACGRPPPGVEEPLPPTSQMTSGEPFAAGAKSTDPPAAISPASPTLEPALVTPPASGDQGGGLASRKVPEDLLEAILADATDRLGLPPEAFAVLWAEAVTWRDGSLGCPQPGDEYAQAFMPGFRVMLEAGGQAYEYHTGPAGSMVLCEVQEPPLRSGPEPWRRLPILGEEMVATPVGRDLETLLDRAKQDLARRLGVAPAGIDVIEIERAEWPDTSLGCGEPGLARLPVAIAGYRIVLRAEAREYVYHTGRESGVVYCAKG